MKERRVTDHAVVRYMERVLGDDIESIRREIRRMAAEGTPFKRSNDVWHTRGIVLMMDEDGEAIVTVLGLPEALKYVGRRLENGQHAGIGENQSDEPAA